MFSFAVSSFFFACRSDWFSRYFCRVIDNLQVENSNAFLTRDLKVGKTVCYKKVHWIEEMVGHNVTRLPCLSLCYGVTGNEMMSMPGKWEDRRVSFIPIHNLACSYFRCTLLLNEKLFSERQEIFPPWNYHRFRVS